MLTSGLFCITISEPILLNLNRRIEFDSRVCSEYWFVTKKNITVHCWPKISNLYDRLFSGHIQSCERVNYEQTFSLLPIKH